MYETHSCLLWQPTLHSGGQLLSSGWVESVVSLPGLWLHPASIDEVTQTVAMVLQPRLGNSGGLGGRPVGKGGQEGADRGTDLRYRERNRRDSSRPSVSV